MHALYGSPGHARFDLLCPGRPQPEYVSWAFGRAAASTASIALGSFLVLDCGILEAVAWYVSIRC